MSDACRGRQWDGPCGELEAWIETAAQESRNRDFYRALVVEIGEMFGEAAYIAEDGGRSEDVLCAKVPDLVRHLLANARPVSAPASAVSAAPEPAPHSLDDASPREERP